MLELYSYCRNSEAFGRQSFWKNDLLALRNIVSACNVHWYTWWKKILCKVTLTFYAAHDDFSRKMYILREEKNSITSIFVFIFFILLIYIYTHVLLYYIVDPNFKRVLL